MRAWLLSIVALGLAAGLVACMTPQQRAAEIISACDAGDGYARIDPPANAQAYRDAADAHAGRYLKRRWPFHEYWFRIATEGRTIVCSVNPDWHPTRLEVCDSRHPAINQYMILFRDTPSGPEQIDDMGGFCVL